MIIRNTILIILIIYLSACTEPEVRHADFAQIPEKVSCVFQNLQIAPSWICGELVTGLYIQGIGMAEKSAAGLNYMKDMARIAALKHLSEKLKAIITLRVKQYVGASGIASTESINALLNSSVKTITHKSIESIENLKTVIGPEGRIYVLVGFDKRETKFWVKKAVMAAIINEQALWQELTEQTSADEVATGIATVEH